MTDLTARMRTIALRDTQFTYQLLRGSRRSVSIRVEAEGVVVRAPRWLALREVEATLHEKAPWILRTMAWWQRHSRSLVTPAWQPEAMVLYRGAMLPLSVQPGRKKTVTHDLVGVQVMAPEADPETLERAIHQWWWREAERVLVPQTLAMAGRLGLKPSSVRLSRARRQWGSCNAHGALRLNWRLILVPPPLAEDVIAHEVAHLCELNHSSRFWSLLESLHPGTQQRKQALAEWAGLLQQG